MGVGVDWFEPLLGGFVVVECTSIFLTLFCSLFFRDVDESD